MADENVVVGEVVTGRRIETEVVVHFVHGPELSASDAADLVFEAVAEIEEVQGVTLLRSEEVVDRQTVTVSAEYAERAGWVEAKGQIGWHDDDGRWHDGLKPLPGADDELDAWWGTDD